MAWPPAASPCCSAPRRAPPTHRPGSTDTHSAIRLIAGANKSGADSLRAGIEIKLQPGWKTYWRYPGDSGVPPRFDFSGSDNVATVEVLYPAPHAFTDEAGTTIGYKGNVIFPLRVVPQQQEQAGARCALKIDYAVCEKLCVPVEAKRRVDAAAGGQRRQRRAGRGRGARAEAGLGRGSRPHRERASDDKAQAAGLRRSRGARRRAGRFVRRGTDGGMGAAHPQAGARRAGRPRRISASNSMGCRPASIPKGPFELTFTIVAGDRAIEVKNSSRLIRRLRYFAVCIKIRERTRHAHQGRRQIAQRHVPRDDRGGPSKPKTTDDIFKGKKVVLFAVPGAFTPTCNNLHMPSFLNNADAIKAKGVDTIAVTGVNDVFVMEAWKKATGAAARSNSWPTATANSPRRIDMAFDGSGNGLGTRSKRYSMLVEDGVVKKLNIEDAPGKCDISGGQALLSADLVFSVIPRLAA